MKKILGIDLGTTSIGWALIQAEEDNKTLIDMGAHVIPYTERTEAEEFGKGQGISKNQARTAARTSRKMLNRYQQRRSSIIKFLTNNNMLPQKEIYNLSPLALYKIRANAANQQVSLREIGRLILLLNQRRGYKHAAEDYSADNTNSEWVQNIDDRYGRIKGKQTIGQFFYERLTEAKEENKYYRIKEKIFPRAAYIEEFDKIWNTQALFYPEILTEEKKLYLRDKILFHQRPLKSQKGLVSVCEFEGFYTKNKEGKVLFTGPKVAPRSSPLFQVCKLWESINAITIIKKGTGLKRAPKLDISPFKNQLFEYLNYNGDLKEKKLFEILKISKSEGYEADRKIATKGIQGNLTIQSFKKALDIDGEDELLRFNLNITKSTTVDKLTGEVRTIDTISPRIETEPLFKLWHICYSIADVDEKRNVLIRNFDFSIEQINNLLGIDFKKSGYGNKSAKAMRKILPHLMNGMVYSDSMEASGIKHSDSLTTEENVIRKLNDTIPILSKNELRQPVVEKILNQMIHQVNTIIKTYGRPDIIRVELARELKQSKEERYKFFTAMNLRTKQAEKIALELESRYHVKANGRNIEKWRLWHEVNGTCIYCGKQISLSQFLNGIEADVEHIIPKSVLFDNSFANKTLSHVECNKAKGNKTAYDYMLSLGEDHTQRFSKQVELLFFKPVSGEKETHEGAHCTVGKISKNKYNRLQWSLEDIPKDFILRQLQETRYISKKAKEILNTVCYDVYSTTGAITEKLRNIWGWNESLENIHIKKFSQIDGLTHEIYNNETGEKRTKIIGWTKRNDHRHHALDALVIACTDQSLIQKINTLNAQSTKDYLNGEVQNLQFSKRLSLLDKFILSKRPFLTKEVAERLENVLVSYKPGNKLTTNSTRLVKINGEKLKAQTNIITPRGPLSESSVYGRIKVIDRDSNTLMPIKYPVKYLLQHSEKICSTKIKALIEERLIEFNYDVKGAVKSLKDKPFRFNNTELLYGYCYEEMFVIKYPLNQNFDKVDKIVDLKVRECVQKRLDSYEGDPRKAFKNLEEQPLYLDTKDTIRINSVRCRAALQFAESIPVLDDNNKKLYTKYVKTGNNHHVGIYETPGGDLVAVPSDFWHGVQRVLFFNNNFVKEIREKFIKNAIVFDPKIMWDSILELKKDILDEDFLKKLPADNLKLLCTLQQNDMYVFGLPLLELEQAIIENNYKLIQSRLYRVNVISKTSINYQFRLHSETKVDDKYNGKSSEMTSKKLGVLIIVQSLDKWRELQPIKVSINRLGKITIA